MKETRLYDLDPIIDTECILRVGGRLRRAELEYGIRLSILNAYYALEVSSDVLSWTMGSDYRY